MKMTSIWVLVGTLLLGGCATCKPGAPDSTEKTEKPEKVRHLGIRDRF